MWSTSWTVTPLAAGGCCRREHNKRIAGFVQRSRGLSLSHMIYLIRSNNNNVKQQFRI
jgi:hypothetical protein